MARAAGRRGRRRETLVQFGTGEVFVTDAARYTWRDPYHAMLALGWRSFLGVILGYYMLVNLLFGALYAVNPASVANLPPGSLAAGFFFSVETFATVGYGVMAPQSLYGHIVATAEIFVGLLSTAVITGLLFVRFSRPRPSVMFARHMTISDYDGVPTLMGRIGNRRASVVRQVEARLTLIALYRTQEGYQHWRALDLELTRPRSHMLALSWMVMHRIDDASPLHGLTTDDLAGMDAQLILTFSGTDQTLAAPVHAIHAYDPPDLLWNHRFGDMVSVGADGRFRIETARFDDVVPV
jgi:inward rectifier potassium channel